MQPQVKGRLACLGSVLHLQNKYGSSYEISARLQRPEDRVRVLAKIQELGAVEAADGTGLELKLRLGKPGQDFSLAWLFEELEAMKGRGEVVSFHAAMEDLEGVFLRMAGRGGEDKSERQELIDALPDHTALARHFVTATKEKRVEDLKSRKQPAERS